MAYDASTAERVRRLLERHEPVEKHIVGGGLGFLIDDNLVCGVRADSISLRVGPTAKPAALSEPHVRPHLVGQRETKAFVVVDPPGYESDEALTEWLDRAIEFAATL